MSDFKQAAMIRVEYELTESDWSAFVFYHHAHSPAIQRQYYRSWIVPPVIWLLTCTGIWYLGSSGEENPFETLLALLPLFSGAPLYALMYPWLYRRKLQQMLDAMANEEANRALFSRHQVVLSSAGITDSSELESSTTAWPAIERVSRADEHVFLYISAMSAIIIPRRAFTTTAEFDQFFQAAIDYHQKAVA